MSFVATNNWSQTVRRHTCRHVCPRTDVRVVKSPITASSTDKLRRRPGRRAGQGRAGGTGPRAVAQRPHVRNACGCGRPRTHTCWPPQRAVVSGHPAGQDTRALTCALTPPRTRDNSGRWAIAAGVCRPRKRREREQCLPA